MRKELKQNRKIAIPTCPALTPSKNTPPLNGKLNRILLLLIMTISIISTIRASLAPECYAKPNIKSHYYNTTEITKLKNTSAQASTMQLNEVFTLIENHYYKKINNTEMLSRALNQMDNILNDSKLLQNFHTNKNGLTKLKQYIKQQLLILKYNANTNTNTTLQTKNRRLSYTNSTTDIIKLCRYMQPLAKQAGLGTAWPAWQMSYSLCDQLDKYSYLLDASQYNNLQSELNGHYKGVGVELIFGGQYPVVFDVIPDSPAARAGIKPSDELININGVNCLHKTSQQITRLLTTQNNLNNNHNNYYTTYNDIINITIQRPIIGINYTNCAYTHIPPTTKNKANLNLNLHNQSHSQKASNKQITISLRPAVIVAPTVRYPRIIETTNMVGYLRIASFDNDTALEMKRAIDALSSRGAQSLILDLRGNGGGVMTSAIDAARLFLNNGVIVKVKSNTHTDKYVAAGKSFNAYTLPLAIMVDKNTASAAEIFTAALKDNHRCTVLGQRTYGKALVQTVYPLIGTAKAVCITTASYLPPSGISFLHKGIVPDVVINTQPTHRTEPASIKEFISPKDAVLNCALKYISKKLARR